MALNFQTLKTRAITALAFVIVMLGGVSWNGLSFIFLFAFIHFGCWYEFIKLMKKINATNYIGNSFLGLAYISLPILMMVDLGFDASIFAKDQRIENLHTLQYSSVIPCGIIFSIWINDTMAYLVGSVIGRTPFSKISPKKTWEGTAGGAILCIIAIGYFSGHINAAKVMSTKHWLIIAAICAIAGTAGDLLESKLKRMANVKDSGSIMPGHGGFLDRFDSLLIAVPLVWLYLKLLA
ncbi:MAG TPA: phosphatidate cytidylyltransferase [Ferruginibacter sp.]|jgi:phosphatidate cytidylyltransferase|nr:phosphatidate cytidylyltransferase [Ferruginibacter sp.]